MPSLPTKGLGFVCLPFRLDLHLFENIYIHGLRSFSGEGGLLVGGYTLDFLSLRDIIRINLTPRQENVKK